MHVWAYSVMVIVVGNGFGDRVQIINEVIFISYSANALGKGTNPFFLATPSYEEIG